MKIILRIPAEYYAAALEDLHREHRFAAERVGFFSTSSSIAGANETIVCVTGYRSIPDEDYIDDKYSGARINTHAIRSALQRILDDRCGQLHVHLHWHLGIPRPSGMDSKELPPLIQSMVSVASDQVHGGLILSRDAAFATLWLSGSSRPKPSARISVVGFPMLFLQ
ncbi:MAG: hypothetical protein QM790_16110 [Nibricoccus sp.]